MQLELLILRYRSIYMIDVFLSKSGKVKKNRDKLCGMAKLFLGPNAPLGPASSEGLSVCMSVCPLPSFKIIIYYEQLLF